MYEPHCDDDHKIVSMGAWMYKGQYHKIQEGVHEMIDKFWSMVNNGDGKESYKYVCPGPVVRVFDNKDDFNKHIDKEIEKLQKMKL